jgi:hypothetical protein
MHIFCNLYSQLPRETVPYSASRGLLPGRFSPLVPGTLYRNISQIFLSELLAEFCLDARVIVAVCPS